MSKDQLSRTGYGLSIFRLLQKYLGVSITLLFIFVGSGIFYATTTETNYRAQVLLGPPNEIDLQPLILASLSISRSKTPEIYDLHTVPAIFQAFKNNLASRAYQQEFLEANSEKLFGRLLLPTFIDTSADGFNKKVPGSNFAGLTVDWHMSNAQSEPIPWFLPRVIKRQFYPMLTIRVDSDKQSSRTDLILSVDWSDPEVAASLANSFVEFINRKTVEQIKELVQSGNSLVQKSLEDYLAQKRNVAGKQIESKIKELDKAISVAKRLGILDPTNLFGDYNVVAITPPPQLFVHPNSEPNPFPAQRSNQYLPLFNPAHVSVEDSSKRVDGFSPPLYARGVRALELERDILLTATSPDDLIENIHGLQESINWLQNIEINPAEINAANIVRSSVPPNQHYGMSFGWILFVFTLLGLLSGIFLALLLYFYDSVRSDRPDIQ